MSTSRFLSGRRRWLALVTVVTASAVGAAAAMSAPATVSVPIYTGCLSATNGSLSQVAPGASPLHPCQSNARQVHLSGLTGITAGNGLDGSGAGTSTPTLALGPSYSLPHVCKLFESPVLNNRHTWSCAALALADQACPTGQFASGFNSVGIVTCASPPRSSGPDLWYVDQLAAQDTPQNSAVTVATLSLPAGTYLLQATGVGQDDSTGSGNGLGLSCWFDRSDTRFTEADVFTSDSFDSFSLSDVRSIAAGDIHLVCEDGAAGTHVQQIVMTALAIGTVH